MGQAEPRAPFEALAQRVEPGSRLVRTWELKGGVSAQVTAFELELADGRREQLVARRHGPRDLSRNPRIAADELELLRVLASAGVPAPKARYVDPDGEVFGTPCLVVDYVDGDPGLASADDLDRFTRTLVEIHAVDLVANDLSFLQSRELTESPTASPPIRRNPRVLLHGDYWPGNTLWRDGRLLAVIDWEDAAIGDPLADVANARLELLWALDADAMEKFTRGYAQAAPAVDLTDLPHWDLWADRRLVRHIGGWGLDEATERALREKRELFVARARAAL